MSVDQLEYAYAGTINKWEPHPDNDGTILVYGMATDPSEDLDGQGCDPEWLKTAMPEWFKFANVREQHGKTAAGVGKELEHTEGDRWMLKSHIVDPGTVAKVKHGVLTGYSVGIREGKVLRGKSAGFKNGKIVGGKIVEVSLVDRPCNPHATITIAKAAPGGDELEGVEPELIDIDPSLYDEDADGHPLPFNLDAPAVITLPGVPSGDDVDGEPDGEQDSQTVDEPVDGDELALFDDDVIDVGDDEDDELDSADVDKALSHLYAARDGDDDEPVTITKGLLESLINGSKKPKAKKDGDHDGKVGEGSERDKNAAAKKRRDAEAERERRHRGKMDAEALSDANHAQRQGRREEADSHRGRLGSYRKALELREYRAGVKLVQLVLDGVITKSAGLDDDAEIVAELAELVAAEAAQLAETGIDSPDDVALLVDACAAIAKMAGAGPAVTKAAPAVVDTSTDGAIVDVAEIVKAAVAEQLSETQKAHEVELAKLHARVEKMAATPLPSGLVVGRLALPSTPAPNSNITKAAELDQWASNPALAPEVREGYRARAEELRRRG